MKLKTKELSNFLKKISMTGKQSIKTVVLDFSGEGLKINATAEEQLCRIMGWLKKTAFIEYEELGKVGMNDLPSVIKILDRFDEEIKVKKEGNLLTITGDKKKVEIELVEENFISTDVKEPALEFDETFILSSKDLKSVFNDLGMVKDAVLFVSTVEKKAIFSNTGKYKFTNSFDAPTCKGGVKVQMGSPFVDSLVNLDGTLEISVKSDYPAKIMEKNENSIITVIVAPRVEDEAE